MGYANIENIETRSEKSDSVEKFFDENYPFDPALLSEFLETSVVSRGYSPEELSISRAVYDDLIPISSAHDWEQNLLQNTKSVVPNEIGIRVIDSEAMIEFDRIIEELTGFIQYPDVFPNPSLESNVAAKILEKIKDPVLVSDSQFLEELFDQKRALSDLYIEFIGLHTDQAPKFFTEVVQERFGIEIDTNKMRHHMSGSDQIIQNILNSYPELLWKLKHKALADTLATNYIVNLRISKHLSNPLTGSQEVFEQSAMVLASSIVATQQSGDPTLFPLAIYAVGVNVFLESRFGRQLSLGLVNSIQRTFRGNK